MFSLQRYFCFWKREAVQQMLLSRAPRDLFADTQVPSVQRWALMFCRKVEQGRDGCGENRDGLCSMDWQAWAGVDMT
ncbi:hypothetical protein ALO59_101829 [Pseudomonas amygdali pv. mellea]|nr:hypothetical protein ALO51_101848 [Pseudomonas amygdali]KPX84104.1 hypothetical protein ALO59_101829 [Pseudomonas amygdali pv. mellea]